MNAPTHRRRFDRRKFLGHTATIGVASLLGVHRFASAEPPPEVSSIRLVHAPAICLSPQYVAEDLLRAEGFSQVEYVELETNTVSSVIAGGRADMSMDATVELIPAIDAGAKVVVLAGIHAGCYELFGNERVRAVRDLKGKTRGDQRLELGRTCLCVEHRRACGHQPAQGHRLGHREATRTPCGVHRRQGRRLSRLSRRSRRSCARGRSAT